MDRSAYFVQEIMYSTSNTNVDVNDFAIGTKTKIINVISSIKSMAKGDIVFVEKEQMVVD